MDKRKLKLFLIEDLKNAMSKENAKRFKKKEEPVEETKSSKPSLAVRIMALKD